MLSAMNITGLDYVVQLFLTHMTVIFLPILAMAYINMEAKLTSLYSSFHTLKHSVSEAQAKTMTAMLKRSYAKRYVLAQIAAFSGGMCSYQLNKIFFPNEIPLISKLHMVLGFGLNSPAFFAWPILANNFIVEWTILYVTALFKDLEVRLRESMLHYIFDLENWGLQFCLLQAR